jgi:hypothetical protein
MTSASRATSTGVRNRISSRSILGSETQRQGTGDHAGIDGVMQRRPIPSRAQVMGEHCIARTRWGHAVLPPSQV